MNRANERFQLDLRVLRRAGVRRPPVRVPPPRTAAAEAVGPQPIEAPAAASRPLTPPAVEAVRRPPVPTDSPMTTSDQSGDRAAALEALHERIRQCELCKLCEKRTLAVPGEGCLDPPILFIGEGPGADEDRSGRPFVGKAGQLLTKMIAAIGLQRDEVFIANMVKCRPPANRIPEPDEARACRPYLDEQIRLLRPRLICTLGAPSTKTLVPGVRGIMAARGQLFRHEGIPLVPTFHPAYLLRQPSGKRQAWEDLKKVAKLALDKEL